ncbi:FtsX-like permease family protein [Promicromonospora vindobonensis]|uniref:FtsX-like permease family protein n=1 Tax=Promicromonospora vindobonensis TaxID=195748 RepID=A0ABW5VQP6_9MICO
MATSMPAARLTLAQMRRSAGRLASAGVAIAIGTAFVAATLLTGSLITDITNNQVTATFADAELVVFGDESLTPADLEATRGVDGVAAADPQVPQFTELNNAGKSVWQQLIGVASDERLAALELTDGAWPAANDEIALPPDVAERLGVGLGDVVASSRWVLDDEPTTYEDGSEGYDGEQAVEKLTVTGFVDDPFRAYPGGGAGVLTQSAIAERLADGTEPGRQPTTSAIMVALEDSADAAAVEAALTEAVPAASDVTATEEYATKVVAQMSGGTDVVYLVFVLAFAAVALVVAGLVIANTFQVLVAQRSRTLALLRCVGATTGQLYRSVLLEAAILGALASLAGIVGGTALVQAGLMIAPAFDLEVTLPETVDLSAPVFIAPLAVGIVVTLASALAPALSAARVAPLAALRPADAPTFGKGAGRVRAVFAALTTLGGFAAVAVGVWLAVQGGGADPTLPMAAVVGGGCLSLIGVIIGSVFWLPKVTSGIGRLAGMTGPSARLATANTLRNPRRTAATATALLIGVTLVGMMTTGAATARATMDNELDSMYPVDIQVSTTTSDDDGQQAAMPPAVADAVADVEELRAVAQVTAASVETPDGTWPTIDVVAAAPDELRAVVNDPDALGDLRPGTLVVPESLAQNQEVDGLDEIVLDGPGGTTTLDVVTGDLTYGTAFIVSHDLAGIHPDLRPNQLWAGVSAGQDVGAVITAVQDAVSTTDEVVNVGGAVAERESIQQVIDMILALVVGLLAVAVVIALIGVANTLSLSVIERTRESAMLRAIGLSKAQLRTMLAIEGMLIAGVGAVLGIVLGLLYGWAGAISVLTSIGDVSLVVPWAEIAVVLGIALVAGLVASVAPARAAVRTHPVAALAAE